MLLMSCEKVSTLYCSVSPQFVDFWLTKYPVHPYLKYNRRILLSSHPRLQKTYPTWHKVQPSRPRPQKNPSLRRKVTQISTSDIKGNTEWYIVNQQLSTYRGHGTPTHHLERPSVPLIVLSSRTRQTPRRVTRRSPTITYWQGLSMKIKNNAQTLARSCFIIGPRDAKTQTSMLCCHLRNELTQFCHTVIIVSMRQTPTGAIHQPHGFTGC